MIKGGWKRCQSSFPSVSSPGKWTRWEDYGRAVRQVYDSFLYIGMQDVSMKLYEDDRHELVNEADREIVWKELYEWIMKTVQAGEASERSENPERSEAGLKKNRITSKAGQMDFCRRGGLFSDAERVDRRIPSGG